MFELTENQEARFGQWLNLNLASLAWEGKHRHAFDEFWQAVFGIGQKATHSIERLDYAKKIVKTGPLYSWLSWLQDRFHIFAFAESDMKLVDYCKEASIEESWLAHILREYFLSLIPHKQDEINEILELGNILSENRQETFKQMMTALELTKLDRHGDEDDMMLSLEVTLFPQWQILLKELKKDLYQLRFDWARLKRKLSWGRQIKFFREVMILLTVSLSLIMGLRVANSWYEGYIIKRIKLLEPTFFGLDLTMLYRPEDRSQRNIELSNEEIDKLERIEGAKSFEEIKDVRFDPESDEVTLTSVDEIPAFSAGDGETSEYEENQKGGYRDAGAGVGKNKAYRVLMAAVSPNELKEKILPMLKDYKTTALGNVKPGTAIPGGIYFNLLVPSNQLKSFLGTVSGLGDATIFESNAREKTAPGKNRVFIWVKSI
ncbi:MAG: hypothetical protein K2P81_15585 [Bacteriovoracaceae bacterium]|nr:hypothetical protein [Bacteriovoracaceae bacterium]